MDDQLREYRNALIQTGVKAQEDYDKAIIALSGGAFGISFAFADKFVKTAPLASGYLLAAWVLWVLSITSVVASYYCSILALRRTVTQVDSDKVCGQQPCGRFWGLVDFLNGAGGVLFLLGCIALVSFVAGNLP